MRVKKRLYMKREVKEDYVVACIEREAMYYDTFDFVRGFTLAEIAKLTGYSRSTSLRELLYDLVDRGDLVMVAEDNKTPVSTYRCRFYHADYAPQRLF